MLWKKQDLAVAISKDLASFMVPKWWPQETAEVVARMIYENTSSSRCGGVVGYLRKYEHVICSLAAGTDIGGFHAMKGATDKTLGDKVTAFVCACRRLLEQESYLLAAATAQILIETDGQGILPDNGPLPLPAGAEIARVGRRACIALGDSPRTATFTFWIEHRDRLLADAATH